MKNFIFLLLFLLSASQLFGDQNKESEISASRYFGFISTILVSQLFDWPDEATLNGDKAVDQNAETVRLPKTMSWIWIKRLFNEPWLPPKNTQMFFLSKEFDGRDVARMAWCHDDYRIEVSQTLSVFAVKIIPKTTNSLGSDSIQRFKIARELCRQIFTRKGLMWSQDVCGFGIATAVPDLNEKIIEFSFDETKTYQFQKGDVVFGKPKSMKDEGISLASNSTKNFIASLTDLHSDIAWYYWFRHVNWWNDGRAVGFYFLKIEGLAAWIPLYFDENDRQWFHISRSRSGGPVSTPKH